MKSESMTNLCTLAVMTFSMLGSGICYGANWNSSTVDSLSDFNKRLECKTTDYSQSGYSDEWSRSWVPPQHTAIIFNGRIESLTTNAVGKVTRETDTKIEFIFDRQSDSRNDGAKVKGVYFKTNGKIMARIEPRGGYRPSGPIWGVCEEFENTDQENVKADKPSIGSTDLNTAKDTCTELGFTPQTEKHADCVLKLISREGDYSSEGPSIGAKNWENVRYSGSTDLFVDSEAKFIKVKSANKWYYELYERFKENPNTDIRVGLYSSDSKEPRPKKYEYDLVKPKTIKAVVENRVKTLIFETDQADRLLSKKRKYVFFLVTDYEKGMWFGTRTEQR